MQAGDNFQSEVNRPVAMTGPVGAPVVEPPGGSSETARVAWRVASARKLSGIGRLTSL